MNNSILDRLPQNIISQIVTRNNKKLYIVDYTSTKSNQAGIQFVSELPSDIESFIINNSKSLDITFCVFKNGEMKSDNGKSLPHCEGILMPNIQTDTTWVVLLELKYFKKLKQGSNSRQNAKKQLIATANYLRNHNIIEKKRDVHLIYSSPKFPFSNFEITQSESIDYKKNNLIMCRTNCIEVISDENLTI
jgi:hypothetical protein